MNGPDRSGRPRDRTERWGFARLTKRAEFKRVSKGVRKGAATFSLQCALRDEADTAPARVGLTLTRQVGGAVERNRIRRRLRAALRLAGETDRRAGQDYVVFAKRDALTADFAALRADLARAFQSIHQPRPRDPRRSRRPSSGAPAARAAEPS